MNRSTHLLWCCALTLVSSAALGQNAKSLVGKYQMEMDPSQTLELRANGTGSLMGEELKWKVKGEQLVFTDEDGQPDAAPYSFDGERLVLKMPMMELVFLKAGAAAPGGKKGGVLGKLKKKAEDTGEDAADEPPAAARAPGAGAGGGPVGKNDKVGQKLAQLLTSSAWCSFSYKGGTTYTGGTWGRSSSTRVVFRPDGSAFVGEGGENYNSGSPGSVASQRESGQGGIRWRVQGERLFMDDGSGAGFQDVGLSGKQNSNGYPILMAGGKEYSMCD